MPNSAHLKLTHPSNKFRVLIVDDNTSAAQALQIVLDLCGYEALVAPTGKEALTLFERHHPSIVLLDVDLPDTDGYSVARALRRIQPPRDTFIIALTGNAANDDVRESLAAGCDLHLAKPVNFDHLERIIHERHALSGPLKAS